MKRRYGFDAALKGLFEQRDPHLLRALTGGIEIVEFLSLELPRVKERRLDLLALLADGSLLHIEFQSTNRGDMALRMAEYYLLLVRKFGRRPVRQVVLYVGSKPLRMKRTLRQGRMTFEYDVYDIREWPAADLLKSGNPVDCVLSVLCGEPDVQEAVRKLGALRAAEREAAIGWLMALTGLRGFETIVRRELKKMPVIIDWRKNSLLREIHDEGREEGREEGLRLSVIATLEAKFERVPTWASQRIKRAGKEQLMTWIRKAPTAARVEDVVPRR